MTALSEPPSPIRTLVTSVVVVFGFVACGPSNPPELNEAARKAADAYCSCVVTATKPDAVLTNDTCGAEEKAYNAAWKALPVAGQDEKAAPIFDYQHKCYTILSDAQQMARSRKAR